MKKTFIAIVIFFSLAFLPCYGQESSRIEHRKIPIETKPVHSFGQTKPIERDTITGLLFVTVMIALVLLLLIFIIRHELKKSDQQWLQE